MWGGGGGDAGGFGFGMGGFGMGGRGGAGGQFVQNFAAYPPSFLETERPQVEEGDKIIMPSSCLDTLARLRITYPMLFEVTNQNTGRKTHCGVLEFIAPEGMIYLPHWMMQNLFLETGDKVTLRSVTLAKGTFVKLRPQNRDFLDISNPKATLENRLRGFSALTKGDTIVIRHAGKQYPLDIMEVRC
jgi:ubiquitin fusion degradation protein 1